MQNFTVNKPTRIKDVYVPFFEISAKPDSDGEYLIEVENKYEEIARCFVQRSSLVALHEWLGQLLATQ